MSDDELMVEVEVELPSWLNAMAKKQGIDFSLALQDGLKQQLHLQ